MLSEIVSPGDKFDIELINFDENLKKITYSSQIYDIIDDDKIVAALPIHKSVIVPLPVDEKYELYIYAKGSLYRCKAVLKERYKEDTRHVMVLEVYSGLQRFQRREFYRLTSNIDLQYHILTESEGRRLLEANAYSIADIYEASPVYRGVSIDISGGGMRFISKEQAEVGSYVYIEFSVAINDVERHFELLSKVISVREVLNRKGTFEHRIHFEKIPNAERERLIKFIFQEERRYRKKEKG